jgi:uncharacterized protein (DUF488 family)
MSTVYTIGHSTRAIQEFLELLELYQITELVDIRTIPKSRRFPWFGKSELAKALKKNKIEYTHIPQLGGLRHALADSINLGWHNASFRGFADYMQTKEFFEGFNILKRIVKKGGKVAIMCAEAVPWRCHRNLISDALLIRGVRVLHIINKSTLKEHELTSFAVVDRTKRPIKIYYP